MWFIKCVCVCMCDIVFFLMITFTQKSWFEWFNSKRSTSILWPEGGISREHVTREEERVLSPTLGWCAKCYLLYSFMGVGYLFISRIKCCTHFIFENVAPVNSPPSGASFFSGWADLSSIYQKLRPNYEDELLLSLMTT